MLDNQPNIIDIILSADRDTREEYMRTLIGTETIVITSNSEITIAETSTTVRTCCGGGAVR